MVRGRLDPGQQPESAPCSPAPPSAGMLGVGGQGVAGGAGSPTAQVLPTKLGWARGLYVRARSPSVLLTTAGSCPCSSALLSGAEAPRGSGGASAVNRAHGTGRLGYAVMSREKILWRKRIICQPEKFFRIPPPVSIETLRKSAGNPVFSARVSFFCPRLRFFTQDRPFCMARELILATIDD